MLIIGEKINATIPSVKDAILKRDEKMLVQLAVDQERAGASLIDINVGTGEGGSEDEIRNMEWLASLVAASIQANLCIDSSDHKVLEAGLKAVPGRAGMINSVKATEQNMKEVLPLCAEYDVPVIALAMDDTGIPKTPEARLEACEKILQGAQAAGVPADRIFFDPLVMPVSTDTSQGMVTLETLKGIKDRLPQQARTVLALSNVSFGLPSRSLINSAMLHMAMCFSVDALLINPLDSTVMSALRAGNAVLGKDRHCRKYTRALRQ